MCKNAAPATRGSQANPSSPHTACSTKGHNTCIHIYYAYLRACIARGGCNRPVSRACAPASHEAVVTAPCPVNTHIGSALITETASVKRSLDAASRSRLPFLLHCPGLGRMHEETTHQASTINAVVTALSGKLCKDTRDAHN